MNYLMHLFLAGDDRESLVGNMMGDFVKGRLDDRYPPGIRSGIVLHRKIDSFAAGNRFFMQSKRQLDDSYGHYKGILFDIFYDHFLAKNWKEYSEKPLEQYANEVYVLMLKNIFLMPEKSLIFLKYAMRTNRLISYATIDGIGEALSGMSRRTTFKSNMEFAVNDLKENYSLFENEFREFFEDAREFVKEYLLICSDAKPE